MNNKPTEKQVSEAAAIFGRKGGASRFKKEGKKGMSKMGKLGAEARWRKKKTRVEQPGSSVRP